MKIYPGMIQFSMEHKGKNRYAPDTVFPPGRTQEETLETTGMSRTEFAERMGITTKYVNNIIKGEVPITEDTALDMERVLGVPASFWQNLEQQYRKFST